MYFPSNYAGQHNVCFSTKLKQQFQTKQVVIRQVVMTAIYCLINHFAFSIYSRKVQAFLATAMAFGTNLVVLFYKALKTQIQGSDPFQALPHRYRLKNHLEEKTAKQWAKTAIRENKTSLTEKALIRWIKKIFQPPEQRLLDKNKPSYFTEDNLWKLLKEAEASGCRDTFLEQVDQTLLVLISKNNHDKHPGFIKITPEKIDEITDKWALFFRDIKTLNLDENDVKVATQYMTYFLALSNKTNFYETFENLKKIATHPDLPKKYFVYAVYLAASEICNPAFFNQPTKFSFIDHPNWKQPSHKKEQFFYDHFAETFQYHLFFHMSAYLEQVTYDQCSMHLNNDFLCPLFSSFTSLQKNQIYGNKEVFDKEVQPLLENLIGYFEAMGQLTHSFLFAQIHPKGEKDFEQLKTGLRFLLPQSTLILKNIEFFRRLFLANIGKTFNPMQEKEHLGNTNQGIFDHPNDYLQKLEKVYAI